MTMLAFIGDQQFVRFEAGSLHMLANATAREGALVVAARMNVALDHLLTILAPPVRTECISDRQDWTEHI